MRTAAPPRSAAHPRVRPSRLPPVLLRPRFTVVLALSALLALSAAAFGARLPGALEGTPEWHRITDLWHAMLDHSSNLIYSPDRFQAMAADMDAMDADTQSLAARKLLPPRLADELRALCHDRYRYLQTRHYTTQSRVSLTAAEAAAATAHWLIELQLCLLRREAAAPQPNPDVVSGAQSSIAYELSFLREYNTFEAAAEQRRQDLLAKGAAGEPADLEAFDNDCQRRRNLLLDAYQARRIRLSRAVRDIMPYLIALTTARPPSTAESLDSPGGF